MSSFPKIEDVPPLLSTSGWVWNRYKTPTFPFRDFWIGTDSTGSRWLTKLKGAFYGYREIVFARLAQRLGWSCQTSTFLELDDAAIRVIGNPEIERFHAAHWFMSEHATSACSVDCPMRFLFDKEIVSVGDLEGSNISHLLDWPKSEFAACLFGANEPPGRLITSAHEFVIIDSEMMFSTKPSCLSGTMWWSNPDGTPAHRGRQLGLQVCREVAALPEEDLNEVLRYPAEVKVHQLWQIAPLLRASLRYAKRQAASLR